MAYSNYKENDLIFRINSVYTKLSALLLDSPVFIIRKFSKGIISVPHGAVIINKGDNDYYLWERPMNDNEKAQAIFNYNKKIEDLKNQVEGLERGLEKLRRKKPL